MCTVRDSGTSGFLPGIMLSLAVDGTVGEMDPGLSSQLLGDAFFVLADSGLFFLENDGDACVAKVNLLVHQE